MAAYGLAPRFQSHLSRPKQPDPGTYNPQLPDVTRKRMPNKIPFLSKTDRVTLPLLPVWCDKIYNAKYPWKIPNCPAFKFKSPRFTHRTPKTQQFDDVEIRINAAKTPHIYVCQRKVNRHLFKGRTPRSTYGDGISVVPHRHLGFKINPDGSKKRLIKRYQPTEFYNHEIRMATDFYRGCRWSNRTSERSKIFIPEGPRPGDYDITLKAVTADNLFNEKLRACRKHTSRQLRCIEMHIQRELSENKPSPCHYNPDYPKCNLRFSGPKAKRFLNPLTTEPGPGHYNIKRALDLPKPLSKISRAPIHLAPFGCDGEILKQRLPEGPSPASYNPKFDHCYMIRCAKPPFNMSSQRFKDPALSESDDEEQLLEEFMVEIEKENYEQLQDKPQCMWSFRSKTLRFKPLCVKENEPSPADFPQMKYNFQKSVHQENLAPFGSGEERFRPWYNWIPVHGMEELPEPGAYELRKVQCYPSVKRGPLTRTCRFPEKKSDTPPPGTYTVKDEIEQRLSTHNALLIKNMENRHKFKWAQLNKEEDLPFREKYSILLQEMIDIIDSSTKVSSVKSSDGSKPKMLKWFLYNHKYPFYT